MYLQKESMHKKRILLIQYREDISTQHEVDCFKKQLESLPVQVDVLNVFLDDVPKNPQEFLQKYAAVIIGGSGQYNLSVGEPELLVGLAKSEHLIKHLLEHDIPTLGVCFGHQLAAKLLGAKVEKVDHMGESGTFEVNLTPEAKADPVYQGLPDKFYATLGHKDSVIDPPATLVNFAFSERCPSEAYKYKQNIYLVQFHPELDIDGMVFRLSLYPEYIKGKTLEEIRGKFKTSEHAQQMLVNFVSVYIK